jgi:hypothetical protein
MPSPDYTTFTDTDLKRILTVAREITLGWQKQHQELTYQAERAEFQARTAERDLHEILAELDRRQNGPYEEMEDA